MSVNGQHLLYTDKTPLRPAIQLSKNCRYDIVAQGFNCDGILIDRFADITSTVKKMSTSGKPGLINLIVSPSPITPATQSMVGMTEDENVIVVPYYDNVPRAFYKSEEGGKKEEGANGHAK